MENEKELEFYMWIPPKIHISFFLGGRKRRYQLIYTTAHDRNRKNLMLGSLNLDYMPKSATGFTHALGQITNLFQIYLFIYSRVYNNLSTAYFTGFVWSQWDRGCDKAREAITIWRRILVSNIFLQRVHILQLSTYFLKDKFCCKELNIYHNISTISLTPNVD